MVSFYYPCFLSKCVTFSYDDGITQDKRLIELFRRYGMKATFNLNSETFGEKNILKHQGFTVQFDKVEAKEVAEIYRGFEVACHGVRHRNLPDLTDEQIEKEIGDDRTNLEGLTQKPVVGMAYACGRYDQRSVGCLRKMGLIFGRTIENHYTFRLPEDFLQWHPTCHDNDEQVPQLIDRFLELSDNSMPLFYIWGHAFELDKNDRDRWANMEEICRRLSEQSDVWYATNGEIARYVMAMRRLQVSEWGAKNDSDEDIYLAVNGQKKVVPAHSVVTWEREKKMFLPRKIYLQKKTEEEWNLYFANCIEGLSPEDDLKVYCQYGAQYTDFWRINPDEVPEGEYPLTITINGVISASTTLVVVKDTVEREEKLLCIGDSMTQTGMYVTQTAAQVKNLKTIGSRQPAEPFVKTEGWGGYLIPTLFGWHRNNELGLEGFFMFPKNVPYDKYWGNTRYWEKAAHVPDGYWTFGLDEFARNYDEKGYPKNPTEGDTVLVVDEGLYQYHDGEWKPYEDELIFDFEKYVLRYLHGEKPDYVSVLLGANDFQVCEEPYKPFEEKKEVYLRLMKEMINNVQSYLPDVKFIINLPVMGASQDAWGKRMRCNGSGNHYKHNIFRASKAILDTFDTPEWEARGVVISPMVLALDGVYGFDSEYVPANKYSPVQVQRHNNWVHPNRVGYNQMGDTLAATIVALRNQKK